MGYFGTKIAAKLLTVYMKVLQKFLYKLSLGYPENAMSQISKIDKQFFNLSCKKFCKLFLVLKQHILLERCVSQL